MSIYVSLEDKQLDEALGARRSRARADGGATGRVDDRVFNSSKELFLALKRSFKRGTALQMGNALIELHVVWAKHLRNYARRVLERLPPMTQPADASAPPQCNLDGGAQQLVCAVINTVRVAAATTAQLADSIAAAVDDSLKEKVDLETPQEALPAGRSDHRGDEGARRRARDARRQRLHGDARGEVGDDGGGGRGRVAVHGGDCGRVPRDDAAARRDAQPALRPILLRQVRQGVRAAPHRQHLPLQADRRGRRAADADRRRPLRQTLLDLPTLGQAAAASPYTKLVASEMAVAEHILKLVTTPEELLEATVDETRAAGVAVDFEKIRRAQGAKAADWTGAEKARERAAAEHDHRRHRGRQEDQGGDGGEAARPQERRAIDYWLSSLLPAVRSQRRVRRREAVVEVDERGALRLLGVPEALVEGGGRTVSSYTSTSNLARIASCHGVDDVAARVPTQKIVVPEPDSIRRGSRASRGRRGGRRASAHAISAGGSRSPDEGRRVHVLGELVERPSLGSSRPALLDSARGRAP